MRKRLQSSDSFYESLSDITMATLGIFVIFFVINVIFVNKDTIEKSVENEKFKKESAEVSSILEKTKLEDLERLQEITDENDKKIKEIESKIITADQALQSVKTSIDRISKTIKSEFNISATNALDFKKINQEIKFRSKKLKTELQNAKVKRGKLGSEYSEYIEAQGETPSLLVYPTSYGDIQIKSWKHGSKDFTQEEFIQILDGINRGSGFNIIVDLERIKNYATDSEIDDALFSLNSNQRVQNLNRILKSQGWPSVIEKKSSSSQKNKDTKDNSTKIVNELAKFAQMIKNNQIPKESVSSKKNPSSETVSSKKKPPSEKKKSSDEKEKVESKTQTTFSNKKYKFIPYQDPPKPIRPIKPKYPRIAQDAGIQGQVIVQCFINKDGIVEDAVVIQGIPGTGLNESSIEAIIKTKFIPAKQNKMPVGVWLTIPVNFTLDR